MTCRDCKWADWYTHPSFRGIGWCARPYELGEPYPISQTETLSFALGRFNRKREIRQDDTTNCPAAEPVEREGEG